MSTPTTAPAGRPAQLSSGRAALIVAEREILAQVRTKSFLISSAITLLLVLGSILVSGFLAGSGDDSTTKVAVVPGTSSAVASADGLEAVAAPDEDAARALVENGDVKAAVLPDAGPAGVRVLVLSGTADEIVASLSVVPVVEELDPAEQSEGIRYLVALAFGLVFMMAAAGSGGVIAQSTVSEKQTRVVEILLSTVSARSLLAGKILGNSIVAFGQMAATAAAAVLGLVLTGQDELLGMLGAPLVWFVVFFLVGFLLLASIYAAGASLVSRVEDTGSVIMPAMMLTMIPYFLVAFLGDNPVVMTVLSYVPFSAPVGMPVRLFFGDAAWWEPLVSLVILAVSTLAVVALAARVYSGSLLRTGARVPLKDALRAH